MIDYDDRNNAYIEYRVYLKRVVDTRTVFVLAGQLQDKIADFVSESNQCEPPIFNEDVTYEIKPSRIGE